MQWPQNSGTRMDADYIIKLLRNYPQLSRAELSTMLPITPATLTHQIRTLIDSGWIGETTAHRSAIGGRPRMGLSVDNTAAYAVTVVVGLTTVDVAVVDFSGHIVVQREIEHFMTAVSQGIAVISETIQEVIEQAAIDPHKWAGVGISIPGIWDPDSETVVFSPNLPQWDGMKIGELFRRSLDVPDIIVENDADAAAWGELWFGAGRDIQDMVYVLCDVGIGAGLVINHQLVRGQDNSVGEIGHMFVTSEGPDYSCGCGHVGCLEAVASLGALNRYQDGGMTQDAALDHVAQYLGMALGSIVNILCPQVVVLGGAMLQSYPVLWPMIVHNTRSRVLNHLMHKTQFILSPLGDHAPLLGLADLVFSRRLHRDPGSPLDTLAYQQWGRVTPPSRKLF